MKFYIRQFLLARNACLYYKEFSKGTFMTFKQVTKHSIISANDVILGSHRFFEKTISRK